MKSIFCKINNEIIAVFSVDVAVQAAIILRAAVKSPDFEFFLLSPSSEASLGNKYPESVILLENLSTVQIRARKACSSTLVATFYKTASSYDEWMDTF